LVGERLRQLRARLGLSQEAMAQLLGVSFTTVNRWESDRRVSGPRGVVLTFLLALESAVQRDPNVREALRDWMARGQPYVLQQVLALANASDQQPKKTEPTSKKSDVGRAKKKRK
jgi:transcriptional regulator with XRE-family HTH domain